MTRFVAFLLPALFLASTVGAAIYQCRDRDGKILLTNNKSKFPPGCEQIGGPIGEETSPAAPSPAPPPPASRVAPSEPRQTQPGQPSTGQGSPGAAPPTGDTPAEASAPAETSPPQALPGEPEPPTGEAPPGDIGTPATEETPATGDTSEAGRAAELERWKQQARAMADRFEALQGPGGTESGKEGQLQQLENRIESFLDRLAASGLTPEEQAEVEAELPPPPQ